MILGMVYHAGLLNYMSCVRPNERLIRLTILYLMDDTTFTRIKMESVLWMVEVSARSLYYRLWIWYQGCMLYYMWKESGFFQKNFFMCPQKKTKKRQTTFVVCL